MKIYILPSNSGYRYLEPRDDSPRKEMMRLEKQRFSSRRLAVEDCRWSWCLTVVTTSRFSKIPVHQIEVSRIPAHEVDVSRIPAHHMEVSRITAHQIL
jgi:hypothetical protein